MGWNGIKYIKILTNVIQTANDNNIFSGLYFFTNEKDQQPFTFKYGKFSGYSRFKYILKISTLETEMIKADPIIDKYKKQYPSGKIVVINDQEDWDQYKFSLEIKTKTVIEPELEGFEAGADGSQLVEGLYGTNIIGSGDLGAFLLEERLREQDAKAMSGKLGRSLQHWANLIPQQHFVYPTNLIVNGYSITEADALEWNRKNGKYGKLQIRKYDRYIIPKDHIVVMNRPFREADRWMVHPDLPLSIPGMGGRYASSKPKMGSFIEGLDNKSWSYNKS